ncbi:beta-lactamase-like protein [Chlamydoabsidia padenii]|nr:beta-lactamase-like protein [Chlamydoabsidia padenii]
MVAAMDITFLGTGSAQPSTTRNHQAMALRVNGDIWLFDCGEATQHQFQKSHLKMGRITKIFITHMHGDHCFGLAPLLCSMTDNLNPNKQDLANQPPIDIYGPARLRRWLGITLSSTYSHLGRPYRVHELLDDDTEEHDAESSYHPQELPSTHHRLPATLDLGQGFTMTAAAITHAIPSLGFVIQEPQVMGRLDHLIPLLQRNAAALLDERGIKQPLTLLGQLQRTGERIELPDGTWLDPPEKKRGRQVVILGDTCDPSSLAPHCHHPHLLVHEATNALTSLDDDDATLESVQERAISHGHSTPQMAGSFAKGIGARTLILTHFSARYKGDVSGEAVMDEIKQLALDRFGSNDIYCARDLWSFDIKLQ